MIIRIARFNTYLLCVALLITQFGCQTGKSKKPENQLAALSLHMEANRDDLGRSQEIRISRVADVKMNVDKEPFLDEALLTEARIIDDNRGFSISIQFEKRGMWLLEQYTARNPGKHIAIQVQFGEKFDKTRWLAAPLVGRRISDGRMTFTPDATREEAEQIVKSLNNTAIKNGNQEKPKKPKST